MRERGIRPVSGRVPGVIGCDGDDNDDDDDDAEGCCVDECCVVGC